MTAQELNADFLDLYGDVFNIIELKESPTFETILTHMPKGSENRKLFSYKGKKIEAYRKFVIQRQKLKSQYLHILIEDRVYGNGTTRFSHYREDKKGNFIFVEYLEEIM